MAGGKGKDMFIAESISSVCFLRCHDLWQHYSPRQESGEDLDSTWCFFGLGKPGGGKGTSFSGWWAVVARDSSLPEIATVWQVGGPWGSCQGERAKTLLWLQRLILPEWLFGEVGNWDGSFRERVFELRKCFRATCNR